MRKRFCLVLFFLIAFNMHTFALSPSDISAKSAVLMVADTGEIVFQKNAHQKRSMASTTKIMTALLTLECATPQRVVITTSEMVNVEGTSMGLLPGDKVTFNDLVYGMLLASGNDAANTAAISIDGSIKSFAARMNKKAKQLGMENTVFVTPSGLDDENHYSTAYDMALLACYALQNPDFREACSCVSAQLCYGNEPYSRRLTNHNRLLKTYDGAIGIKTGFTKKSGRCLVSAAERNGVTLVCVTLSASDDWNDHKKLLDFGFENISFKSVECNLPDITVFGGDSNKASLMLSQPINVPVFSRSSDLSFKLKLKNYEFAPILKGDILGSVSVLLNGKTIDSVPVIAAENVRQTTEPNQKRFSLLNSFNRLFSNIKEFFKERQTAD